MPGAADKKSTKPADLAAHMRKNDTNAKIQDKIKKWQTQGGGIVLAPDVGASTDCDSERDAASGPHSASRTSAHKTGKSVEGDTQESPVKPAAKPKHNPLTDDVRAASAPKKRVVSDGHWRKQKSPPKSPPKEPSPEKKPIVTKAPTAWVRPASKRYTKPSPSPSPTKESPLFFTTKPPQTPTRSPEERMESIRRRRRAEAAKAGEAWRQRTDDDGVRDDMDVVEVIYESDSPPPRDYTIRKHNLQSHEKPRRRSHSSEEAGGDVYHSSGSSSRRRRRRRRRRKSDERSDNVEEDRSDRRLKEDEQPVREPSKSPIGRRRTRRRRSSISEQSPVIPPVELLPTEVKQSHRKLQKQPPPLEEAKESSPIPAEASPKVFVSRVDAWLSSTPDPFIDTPKSKAKSRSVTVSSTSSVARERETNRSEPSELTTGSASRRHGSSRKSRPKDDDGTLEMEKTLVFADTPKLEPKLDDTQESPTPSVSSLKRRGARRGSSPKKTSRIVEEPETKSEVSLTTASSASVDPSAFEGGSMSDFTPKQKQISLPLRRQFPSTGKKLSTIVSMDSLDTSNQTASEFTERSEDTRSNASRILPSDDGRSQVTITGRKNSTRNRLATHADLMSVLSLNAPPRSKSIVSARSIRTYRTRLATATLGDIMNEVASDEKKYMRELRTLVDGVIPVLLSCVLSKSDSAVAAGLFSKTALKNDPNVTRPIVDMGVALERLKIVHKRIPQEDPEALLSWAQSAHKVYSDYLKAWRLGFQDVVVNLAPAVEGDTAAAEKGPNADGWENGMSRNSEGYVVNGDGERVDVAFLLKRPLVRLKYLAKTLKGINTLKPSEKAGILAGTYQELVDLARKRNNEERARLEDEAAAAIDPTRARDPRSLAPLSGVLIDATRRVRARDYFDMHIQHSSGQEVDCRTELLFRDDAPGTGSNGDVLLCEVDGTGRWLFLPPIQLNRISARQGANACQMVVMVRGISSSGHDWQELFTFTTDDEEAVKEWVDMLGSDPMPPQVTRAMSFISKAPRPTSSHASSSLLSAATGSTTPLKSRTPSPTEIEVPIGERATAGAKKWSAQSPTKSRSRRASSDITAPSSVSEGLASRDSRDGQDRFSTPPRPTSRDASKDLDRTPRSLNDAMALAGGDSPGLKRGPAKRYHRSTPSSPVAASPETSEPKTPRRKEDGQRPKSSYAPTTPSSLSQSTKSSESVESAYSGKGYSVWYPVSDAEQSDESDEGDYDLHGSSKGLSRAHERREARRTSSVPSLDLPTIPRLRNSSGSGPSKHSRSESLPILQPIDERSASTSEREERSKSKKSSSHPEREEEDTPPPTPPHRSIPKGPLSGPDAPVFAPTLPAWKTKRRSSSPLKHEYEPSTATESTDSESDGGDIPDDESVTSESSQDSLEEDDIPTPLMPINIKKMRRVSPPASLYSLPNGTISPSQSASNTPYRSVPANSTKASKTIASIFSWSDQGRWDSLHQEDCSIVITPGLIEAFELTSSHSRPLVQDGDEITPIDRSQPLVALELTPLVPLRRGTAVDISIRSPPTSNSKITNAGNNIMFRTRSPEECEALYAMLNHARINNPTYIALQNARGPYGESTWAAAMDRRNSLRAGSTAGSNSSSWWSGLGRRRSYRASNSRAPSTIAETSSSVPSAMSSSMFSALKRFSTGGRLFNVAQSSISSRNDGQSSTNSLESRGSVSRGGSSGSSTPSSDPTRAVNAPLGITNTKIRLYERETQSKWRDMGSARLTIMSATSPSNPLAGSPRAERQGQGSPGVIRQPNQEKRILITGKTKGETLLDVTLGESCFERVARTGIAVSVWEDLVGPNGEVGQVQKEGGVYGVRCRVFMMQLRSERETAWSFGMLGKLRY